jgi:CubicO group peptidase (beta-lactamase class C family)
VRSRPPTRSPRPDYASSAPRSTGGAISTAADVALFYQALLANRDGMWNADVLIDATTRIRNPHLDVPRGFSMNYGLGVRIGGDDGHGVARGLANAPTVFGHDGAGGQIAWADRATGLSVCYLTNGLDDNLLRQRRRVAGISYRAFALVS